MCRWCVSVCVYPCDGSPRLISKATLLPDALALVPHILPARPRERLRRASEGHSLTRSARREPSIETCTDLHTQTEQLTVSVRPLEVSLNFLAYIL